MKQKSKINIKPIGDHILVKRLDTFEKTRGGILIPDSAKEKPQEATVIAVGCGKRNDNSKRTTPEVAEGDVILLAKYGGTEITIDDEAYLLLREEDILAIIE